MTDFGYSSPTFADAAGIGGTPQARRTALTVTIWVIVGIAVFFLVSSVAWAVWYRDQDYGSYLWNIISWIGWFLFWPIRFLLTLMGFYGGGEEIPIAPLPILPIPPSKPALNTVVTKHEITDCPPCNVDVQCPPCNDGSGQIEPLELEIKYLKDMVKFTGAIAKRENAINAQYKELYPGFNVLSPHVRKLSHEYNYIKEEIRKDKDKWQYFKNYFTKLSNIPSTASAVHYDVLLD